MEVIDQHHGVTMAAASASARAPPPAPSHATFILSQVRSGLAHLRASQTIDAQTYEQIDKLLSSAELREGQGDATTLATMKQAETEEERLGKRNAWLREALAETSLLPTLVDTAMQVAVPSAIMGSAQRAAVVELVERSQKAIARAVTDPKQQRRMGSGAWSSAKGTHSGLVRIKNAAGQGLQDIAQKRQEAKERSEEKQREKKERKAMKKELKREREAIARKRQVEMLSGGDGSVEGETGGSNHSAQSPTASSALPDVSSDEDDSEIDSDDEEGDTGFHSEGGVMATVSCGRIDEGENSVGATTTFSPWPGLLLCSTIVAVSDEPIPAAKDVDWIRQQQAEQLVAQTTPLTQRHAVPPPPPPPPLHASAPPSSERHSAPAPAVREASRIISSDRPTLPPPPAAPRVHPDTHAAGPSPPFGNPPSPPPPSAQPPRTEVKDVTDAKQKSWTRKLGL